MTKQVSDYVPILLRLVAPAFVGKDAGCRIAGRRGVPGHYKMAASRSGAGGYVEQSVFDLLASAGSRGRAVGRRRAQGDSGVPFRFGRELKAEQEVDVYRRGVEATGVRS